MIWLIQGCAALLHGKPASTCSVQLLVADTRVVAAVMIILVPTMPVLEDIMCCCLNLSVGC